MTLSLISNVYKTLPSLCIDSNSFPRRVCATSANSLPPTTSHPFAVLHKLKHKSKLSPNSLKMAAVNNNTASKNAPVLDKVKFEEALRNDLVKIVKNLVENKAFEDVQRLYKR